MKKQDVTIVGGGILGTCLSYWISLLFDGTITVLEKERDVAFHTSSRNTGVIHRPFYLNPEKRKIFASSAQISYGLWKQYSQIKKLPWKEIGTLEVATRPDEVPVLERYLHWARQNGMREDEVVLLSSRDVKKLEPSVSCQAALHSRTDCSVNYQIFTQSLKKDAQENGVNFLFGFQVGEIKIKGDGLEIFSKDGKDSFETSFLINCAGGRSIDLAHTMGIASEYTDLHFRGEYWEVEPVTAQSIRTNIYSVPHFTDLPFLDPHWIVREDGRREIGPNAVLVSGPETYHGFTSGWQELVQKIFERPLENKWRLFLNRDFIRLASREWKSSLSKSAMVQRVKRFIPSLKSENLIRRGVAGVRSSVIDRQGNFVKEALEIPGPFSFHVLNYNSPGATGSPAYTACLLHHLIQGGSLNHLRRKPIPQNTIWNFQEIVHLFHPI